MKAEIIINNSVINITALDSITICDDAGAVLYTSAAPEKKRGRKKKVIETGPTLLDIIQPKTEEVKPQKSDDLPGDPMPEAPGLDLDEFEPIEIKVNTKTKEIKYKAFDGRIYVWPERGCVPLRIEEGENNGD